MLPRRPKSIAIQTVIALKCKNCSGLGEWWIRCGNVWLYRGSELSMEIRCFKLLSGSFKFSLKARFKKILKLSRIHFHDAIKFASQRLQVSSGWKTVFSVCSPQMCWKQVARRAVNHRDIQTTKQDERAVEQDDKGMRSHKRKQNSRDGWRQEGESWRKAIWMIRKGDSGASRATHWKFSFGPEAESPMTAR